MWVSQKRYGLKMIVSNEQFENYDGLCTNRYIFLSRSPASTLDLGKRVGRKLKAGSIVALIGELGCGKTLFTKGICVGLGMSARWVNSPTFTFVNEYLAKFPVFHIDLYRLEDIGEGFEIGITDYLIRAESGIAIVEWAGQILPLLRDTYLQVQFSVLSARERRIVLVEFGERFGNLLKELGSR